MIDISCIFCNSAKAFIAIEENGYQGKKCDPCNLIYISPRPSQEEIANMYGHDQAYIPANTHIEQEYAKKLHAQHTLKLIKSEIDSGDLLELGSGAGYFLRQARKQGFTPYGIELNPIQAQFMHDNLGIPCLSTPLTLESFGAKTFDVIYHSDVLSHFYDPIQAMQTIHAKLKPGGILVFETGNIADIDSKYYPVFNAMQYPDHLFFFGKKSLLHLLDHTGFKVEKYYGYSILAQLRIIQLIKKLKKVRDRDNQNSPAAPVSRAPVSQANLIKGYARHIYHFFLHTIRYYLGRYLPQENRPQTVIIIARKNGI
jgi:2-polyprenyl-3-methyl-5-hydroxy-6-metoxy-1,4-benzoquinol methylase